MVLGSPRAIGKAYGDLADRERHVAAPAVSALPTAKSSPPPVRPDQAPNNLDLPVHGGATTLGSPTRGEERS
jgi:hypothetical protein